MRVYKALSVAATGKINGVTARSGSKIYLPVTVAKWSAHIDKP